MAYSNSLKLDSIKRVSNFIIKNKTKPNYVMMNNDKVLINNYIKLDFMKDALNRINKYIDKNNVYPKYVDILGFHFMKSEYQILFKGLLYKVATPKSDAGDYDAVTKYFKNVFGSYNSFDGALALVKDRGYAHYYNPVYTNKESIDRIKKGKGINCSDGAELFWHIGKSLGYKVDYIHVKCSGGDGHIRLRLIKNNKTYYRDPAAVLSKNGQPVTYNWCMNNYKLLAINPSWIGKQA